jgi:maleylpyruvate isomerase
MPAAASGTELFLSQLDAVADGEFAAPSRLPGWSRADVCAHVARNAEALDRLLGWARSGVETPMYGAAGQRERDIARSARQPVPALREDVRATAVQLRDSMLGMPAGCWNAEVRTTRGRVIPATVVPWMRIREVWLHALDLGAAATIDDIPGDVCAALIDDVSASMRNRPGRRSLRLIDSATGRTWATGASTVNPQVVRGTAGRLAGWLTGRGAVDELTSPEPLPQLPAWL